MYINQFLLQSFRCPAYYEPLEVGNYCQFHIEAIHHIAQESWRKGKEIIDYKSLRSAQKLDFVKCLSTIVSSHLNLGLVAPNLIVLGPTIYSASHAIFIQQATVQQKSGFNKFVILITVEPGTRNPLKIMTTAVHIAFIKHVSRNIFLLENITEKGIHHYGRCQNAINPLFTMPSDIQSSM